MMKPQRVQSVVSEISEKTTAPSHVKAVITIFVCLNLIVFLLRAISVLRYGSLFGTTGGESLMVYSIWKGMRGYAIYEWPLIKPFSLSLYNYLFYFAYVKLLRLAGWWDAEILTFGRMITAAFAALGAIAQWKLVQAKLGSTGHKYWCLALCFGLWFSTSFVRWWAITIRPDIPAAALVMLALLCLGRIEGTKGAIFAGIFFYLAWSFKQSVGLVAASSILYLFVTRRRSAFALFGFVLAEIVITVFLGTAAYRYSIFIAPGVVSSFTFFNALNSLKQPLAVGCYVWIPLGLLLARPWRRNFDVKDLLRASAIVSFGGGIIAMTKGGGGDNYLFEAFIAAATFLLIETFENPVRPVVTLFLALGCIQPAIQIGSQLLHVGSFGTVQIADSREFRRAQLTQQRVALLPKPMFTTDEVFSLPWNSSNNSYPAYVIDLVFETAARHRYSQDRTVALVKNQEVESLMIRNEDPDLWHALKGKYSKIGEEDHQHFHYEVFTKNRAEK
jgi:hypothetical protein